MPSVTWRREDSSPPVIFLEGVLDETATLQDLAAQLTIPTVLDLRGVRRVSSAGTRNWLNLMRKLNGSQLTLRACSRALVEQMNMLLDFTGGARVESILVPYECPSCNASEVKLVDVPALRARLLKGGLPRPVCPNCRKDMELTEDEQGYFLFLRYI